MALQDIKNWHQGMLNKSAYKIDAVVGAEAANVVTVTGQIRDIHDNALADTFTLLASGEDPAEFTLAVSTGTGLSKTARGSLAFQTNASGAFAVTVTDVGGGFNGTAAIEMRLVRSAGSDVPCGYAEPIVCLCAFDA